MERVALFLERQPRGAILAANAALLILLGAGDTWAGAQVSLAVLYLIPICVVAWYAGRGGGLGLALAGGVVRWVVDLLLGVDAVSVAVRWWDALSAAAVFLLTAWFLSFLRQTVRGEKKAGAPDLLTGVVDLPSFAVLAEREISRSRRYGEPLTMIHIDVDDLEGVNVRFGRRAGDELLRSAAEALRSHVRETDVVARLEGDEFAVLLPRAQYEAAKSVIARLRQELLQAARGEGHPVTFSMGAVTFLSAPFSVQEMLRHADDLMGSAKLDGKGSVRHEVWG